jgi:cytidylate kinase
MTQETREPRILAAAEQQMREWAIAQEMHRPSGRAARALLSQIHPYIAISREAGTGGSEIAQRLGRHLGWGVYDKNLLDQVADRYQHDREALDFVDETQANWVYDVLGTWLDRRVVPHETYVWQLGHIVLSSARAASCIFVGRGAQFVLPRAKGLAVRLIASERFRVQRLMQEQKLDRPQASQVVEQLDRGRAGFVQRFFHHDAADPHLYDLVLNVERLGFDRTVEMILAAAPR